MKRYLPILILLLSILYIFFIPSEPVSVKILFKVIPMLLIIFYASSQRPIQSSKYRTLLLLGLIFCMIGDGTLIWFVIGLSAFLIGHLFYTAGFITEWKFSIYRMLTIIPIAIYAFILCSNLVNSLNESGQENLVIPVIAYSVAISMMVFTAIMTGNKWAICGSLLFIISDSILSWDLFVESVTYGHELIMITYYSAQFLIAKSMLNLKRAT
ncbi:lysoplasmalogenase [Bacillus sp. AFS041924]|uniref:lysoplasmalogenase n=1 Tax=Bacillus sp. AFS041924 TaxID=2033503 RepID=UPI000BFB8415|nr:lysoplasmalogenase [Bacillus sp. AFS041924]PGS55244.1 lysoplasmalogenase [Bacillus sp. AFS041924]